MRLPLQTVISSTRVRIATRGGQGSKPLPESWVTINVEEKPIGFMVDTGAQYSVLNQKDGPMSKKSSWVQGATGTK